MPAPEGTKQEEVIPPAISIPDGIKPLFFSGPSQQIFECVVDTHLTSDNPHKLILKAKILDDFKTRAAVCDFHPVKKQVQAYPGEELLIVYDHDFQYGENFYICITEEAKERILNPPKEDLGEEGVKEGGSKEEEEDDVIPSTPVPREWECLGSDTEIRESLVTDSRPLISFKVSRKRMYFNSPVSLSDHLASVHSDLVLDISPHDEPNYQLCRSEMDIAVQAVPDTCEGSCQTEWRSPVNAAVQYSPRELPPQEAHTQWESQAMSDFLSKAYPRMELSLQQNQIMDILADDYTNLSETDFITGNKSDTNLKEYQSFTDLKFSKDKLITCVDWHPTIKGIIAVSCGQNYSFDERIQLSNRLLLSKSLILIWSFTDPIHPQLFLEAPDDVLCFKFNPSDPNIVIGGCANGQVVLWDLGEYQDRLQVNKSQESSDVRSAAANMAIFDTDPKLDHAPMVQYAAVSSIKDSHSLAVCHVQWVPEHIEVSTKNFQVLEGVGGKTNQIISASIDGNVLFWDIRPSVQRKVSVQKSSTVTPDQPYAHINLTWKPFLKLPLARVDFPGMFSVTRVSIHEKHKQKPKASSDLAEEPSVTASGEGKPIEGASTMFFIGSEDGEVAYYDWVPMRDSESGKLVPSPPKFHSNTHNGPVSCVERSPFFRDIVLSVGGWTWAIWREGSKGDALLKSHSSSVQLTGGAWCPTRPGVFFVTKANGNVDVWDLMDRSHEPLLAQNVSPMCITSVYPWPLTSKQLMLAVGDSGGTLHILEVPWSLSHPSSNEVSIMKSFFEREEKRLDSTTQRLSTRKIEKKKLDSSKVEPKTEEGGDTTKAVIDNSEELAKKEYDEYLSMELKLLVELGLVQLNSSTDD
ncbi:dynein axonemal intermediate chain 3-like isoform X2 [Halichondria panicea]|uniref:dynein axonemal intermediate chain 3-like isoform X2 n=1 Tax=Halichondria panicea TaxID=6063 RepID=UPI00312B8B4A